MELFKPDGHLSDEGLRTLVGGGLDELGRLEAGEHLDFCGACLARYTALLTDDVLLAPAQPLRQPVVQSLRRRGRQRAWLRFGSIAAAACMMLAIWGLSARLPGQVPGASADSAGQGWIQTAGEGVQNFFGNIGSWVDGLFTAEPGAQDAAQPGGEPDAAAQADASIPPKPNFQPPPKPAAADDSAPQFMTAEEREALFEKQNAPVGNDKSQ